MTVKTKLYEFAQHVETEEDIKKLLDTLNVLGQQKKPVERLYARMLDEQLFIAAYVKLYANDGAMTVGTDAKDVIDGMSLQRIRNIIQTLKNNEWEWKPVRRTQGGFGFPRCK